MVISSRWRGLGGGLATLLLLAVLSHSAQESVTPGGDAPAPAVKRRRPYEPVRLLPDFFGQIGLTMEQREAIYKIRARHLATIEELEKQVDEIEARMASESLKVLTEHQRQLLAARQRAATSRTSKPVP